MNARDFYLKNPRRLIAIRPNTQYLGGPAVEDFSLSVAFSAYYPDALPNGRLGNDGFSLNVVLSGRGRYRDSHGRFHELAKGSAFQRVGHLEHSTDFVPGETYSECYFTLTRSTSEWLYSNGFVEPERAVLHPARLPDVIAHYDGLYEAVQRQEDARRVLARLIQLISFVYAQDRRGRPCSEETRLVNLVRDIVEDSLKENLSVQEIARRSGHGYESLRKIFRKETGTSLKSYCLRRRMDFALRLLRVCSVKEVAATLNYADPYIFSRQFKRVTGLAPTEYQRQAHELSDQSSEGTLQDSSPAAGGAFQK